MAKVNENNQNGIIAVASRKSGNISESSNERKLK
jgi:hypothetical protein